MASTATDPGADLAQWAATGDRVALERALAQSADAAHAQACRLLGRSADADDATQEALVQLVHSAKRYDPVRPFRPWLARIVHDACCRVLRSGRRRRRHEAAVEPPPPPSEPVDAEAVRAAVQELPESLRAAVELHYFAGLDQIEAARALGIGEGACAMRLSRARERLRDLLRRRGVGVTAAVALAALSSSPAHAAPTGLAASVAVQAATGTLPATTIPLTCLQTGAWLMATHPILTATCAAGLMLAVALPFTLHAGEAATAAAAAPAAGTWSEPARGLLPYLDPTASFRLAIDLETLRPQMLTAKPFTMLKDPRMANVVQAAPGRIDQFLGQLNAKERFFTSFWFAMAGEGRGLTYAERDATYSGSMHQRMLVALDAGTAAPRLVESFDAVLADRLKLNDALNQAESVRLKRPLTPPVRRVPPNVGPFTGKLVEFNCLAGCDGPRFVFASIPWLTERVAAVPAPAPPSAAWFHFDAGALLGRYAALSGPTEDPALVGAVLGTGWRTLRPVVDGRIDVAGDEITASLQVTGAAPFSPLVPLTLLAGGTTGLPFGQFAAVPMRQPRVAIPASADRVASLAIGLTLPPPAQPFTKAVTGWDRGGPDMARDLVLRMLTDGWSGDVALELRPGAPLPRAALVLGLRPGTAPLEAARQIAVWLALPQEALDEPGPLPRSISGITAAGQITITACADRLVVTGNAEPAEWPGITTAAAPADAPACSAIVDLPMAARTWWPLLVMATPAEQRGLLPPLPVALDHLPVWRLRWEATADGCRIDERGLPLAAILTAAACIRTAMEADPERETWRNLPVLTPQAAPEAAPPVAF